MRKEENKYFMMVPDAFHKIEITNNKTSFGNFKNNTLFFYNEQKTTTTCDKLKKQRLTNNDRILLGNTSHIVFQYFL